MSNQNITRSWKGPVYQSSLSEAGRAVNTSVAIEGSHQEPGTVGVELPAASSIVFDSISHGGTVAARKSRTVDRPIVALARIAVGLTAMFVLPGFAETHFVPSPQSFAYDAGVMPSVGISGTCVVEVHQAAYGSGPLWSRSGHIQADGSVIWYPKSFQYDQGSRPSVAVSGTNVIEVHEGSASGFGPLWFKTGQIQPDGTVTWSSTGYQYDNGAKPSVALSGNDVIEVHQGSANGFGPLWYKTGRIQPNGKVIWNSNGAQYDNGGAPRIAMSGPNIIEVHQGSANVFGPLWYKTGQFQADTRVRWSSTAYYYDNGGSPAVSLAGGTILEVHQGSDNVLGPLWFHAGQFQADGAVTWDAAGSQYDTGGTPSVALAGAVALAVHQGAVTFGLELYRTLLY
jgi:hypothetical protein